MSDQLRTPFCCRPQYLAKLNFSDGGSPSSGMSKGAREEPPPWDSRSTDLSEGTIQQALSDDSNQSRSRSKSLGNSSVQGLSSGSQYTQTSAPLTSHSCYEYCHVPSLLSWLHKIFPGPIIPVMRETMQILDVPGGKWLSSKVFVKYLALP